MTRNKVYILYCGRLRFLRLEKLFLSCLNYNRSQSPSQRQWVFDENTEDQVLWLVASVGKVVLCESLSSSINIIPSCDNDNYARRRGDLVQVTDQQPVSFTPRSHYWTSSSHCRCKDVSTCPSVSANLVNFWTSTSETWISCISSSSIKSLIKIFPGKEEKISTIYCVVETIILLPFWLKSNLLKMESSARFLALSSIVFLIAIIWAMALGCGKIFLVSLENVEFVDWNFPFYVRQKTVV